MTDRVAYRTPATTDPIPLSTAAHNPSPSSGARRGLAAAAGAIGAAFLASLCCMGPLLFVTLGVGAGLASTFEPLRLPLTVLTLILLAVGFYVVYGRKPAQAATAPSGACTQDATCTAPRHRTRDEILLWIAAFVALVFLTFPQWSMLLV
ncbi:MAG: hypothetical protein ABS52_04665 [Gemmatimonadetes bacterium SCN 70-22]|nr:MAG: hypothetical protein ABS52_04665 [Gemmatimonadetes bacterium SCN 70-22]